MFDRLTRLLLDREMCLGRNESGAICASVCPDGTPRFGQESNAKMQKCDLCLERWDEGKQPVCVAACPMRALDAGDLDKLRQIYDEGKDVPGFKFSVVAIVNYRQR